MSEIACPGAWQETGQRGGGGFDRKRDSRAVIRTRGPFGRGPRYSTRWLVTPRVDAITTTEYGPGWAFLAATNRYRRKGRGEGRGHRRRQL